MFFLFATLALLALVAFSPRYGVVVIALSLLVTIAVKITTKLVSDVEPTLGESFKAVLYGIGIVLVAVAAMVTAGGGSVSAQDGLAVGVLALLFAAYTAGFKVALGTGWRASGIVAIVATLVSGAFLYSVRHIA